MIGDVDNDETYFFVSCYAFFYDRLFQCHNGGGAIILASCITPARIGNRNRLAK